MQTRIATRVIIYHQGKVLLSRNQGQDFWYPGGGGWKDDEDLIECCQREVLEETGQKIKVIDLMYIEEFYRPQENRRTLTLFFLAQPIGEIHNNPHHFDTDTDNRLLVEENKYNNHKDGSVT